VDSWSILRTFVILHGHLVYFVLIWYIFPRFGKLSQEESGNSEVNQFIATEKKTVFWDASITDVLFSLLTAGFLYTAGFYRLRGRGGGAHSS
jgi:hypothetical protein